MKIYIWGTGVIAKQCMKFEDFSKHELLGFIQTHKTQDMFLNKSVFEPQEIAKTDYDLIIVCIQLHSREIMAECEKQNIALSKVFFIDNYEWVSVEINKNQLCSQIKTYFPYVFEKSQLQKKHLSPRFRNSSDLIDTKSVLQTNDFTEEVYSLDYFRYRTFEFLAREINKANVAGAVAEVGVFRGNFARLINACFTNKKMYLFDTFESFNKEEFEKELSLGRCKSWELENYKNTSVDFVLSRMLHQICAL